MSNCVYPKRSTYLSYLNEMKKISILVSTIGIFSDKSAKTDLFTYKKNTVIKIPFSLIVLYINYILSHIMNNSNYLYCATKYKIVKALLK